MTDGLDRVISEYKDELTAIQKHREVLGKFASALTGSWRNCIAVQADIMNAKLEPLGLTLEGLDQGSDERGRAIGSYVTITATKVTWPTSQRTLRMEITGKGTIRASVGNDDPVQDVPLPEVDEKVFQNLLLWLVRVTLGTAMLEQDRATRIQL
jgi:hypothetical protein